ncbi:hypothetical protein [Flavonifractor sp. HCP28S3_F3]|uniref:hypothetical protein n=1 Tax=Flavonifractor sp. HCP28S3_F3 TaxID=3438939 RepID=UPI003F8C1CBC
MEIVFHNKESQVHPKHIAGTKLLTLGNLAIISQALNALYEIVIGLQKSLEKIQISQGLTPAPRGTGYLKCYFIGRRMDRGKIDARAKWLHKIAETLWNIQP